MLETLTGGAPRVGGAGFLFQVIVAQSEKNDRLIIMGRVAKNKGRKKNNLPIFIRSFKNSGIESIWYKATRAAKTK